MTPASIPLKVQAAACLERLRRERANPKRRLNYVAFADPDSPWTWVAGAIDHRTGEFFTTEFTGRDAETKARQRAALMNAAEQVDEIVMALNGGNEDDAPEKLHAGLRLAITLRDELRRRDG